MICLDKAKRDNGMRTSSGDVGGHSAAVDLSELHTMAKRDPDSQAKQRIVGEVDGSAILEWWLLVG